MDETATPPRPRRRQWGLRLVVVAALSAVLGGAWWWTHPSVFGSSIGNSAMLKQPVDQPTYLGLPGLPAPHRETLTFTGYDVHFSRNSAAATGSLTVCTPRDPNVKAAVGGGTPIDLHQMCRALRPVRDGTRMKVDGFARGDYLILTVHPTRHGRATVDDIRLSYRRDRSHLYQQGTQHVDGQTVVTVITT